MGNIKEFALLHLFFCITFLVSGLTVNLLQLILYILLSRVNRKLFRTLNYYLIYTIYAQLLFLADWWSAAKLNIYSAPDVLKGMGEEHAIILMNHHYELDWLYGWMVGDSARLLGNARVYVKKMLKYVPIIGWAWGFSDVAFLERNWEKDKDNLAYKINQLLDYPSPVWILLFPEGTRFSQEKFAASQKFAAARGLPELQHHLIPRTKGFSFTVSQLDPTRISTVYDVTLVAGSENSAPPTLTSAIRGKETVANMYIRKFDLKDIPKDEEGSSAWLMKLFQEKDALKDSYSKTGCFSELSGMPKYKAVQQKRRICSLLICIGLNLIVNCGILALVWTGSIYTRIAVLVFFVFAWLAMDRLVNITKISKSSAYGKTSPEQTKKNE
ncbi:1-acyl-sn-glycerol-3-phosphate acyltransferase delta isoform X2 [Eurytemora carolleeae]|uniref:1-acyl-sn-glycerol-3-phosphate acyltransferase delta isoform X2 n=1 Tax=Eurytemora carolleeae TaxID=1294199 RepID=UPI000C789C13|nr:1-acyl-sn-glycerol-3-phosphate acyltransferase delta isoform X2 [Eurytemora carolleeae]|eukprot:XP_023322633.1 1-acyl-sn-glycerol-3-phosphate acyltransferase delta-like isoform X2 [Eurytemora affinis]